LTKASDQDFATMPRLTFNRKDMAGQSIGIATAMTGISSADSTRPLSVPMKSERGSSLLILGVFFTRTGVHFARKRCSDASKRLQCGVIVAFGRSQKPGPIQPRKPPARFWTGFPAAKRHVPGAGSRNRGHIAS
jgi:hypothetical protein